MSETVFAAFADAAQAESAASALLDSGVAADAIGLVLSADAKKRIEGGWADAPALGSQPTIIAAGSSGLGTFDPLGNELRLTGATPPIPGGNLFPIGETAEVNHELDPGLNPAQNDYPRTGSDSPTELSSRPPNSKYDWNPDLDKKSYNDDYEGATSEKVDDEIRQEGDRDRARVDPASVNKENDAGTIAGDGSLTDDMAGAPADHAPVQAAPLAAAHHDVKELQEAGVHTTTVDNAAVGAARGVAAGIGLGALAGVAAIALPGVGFVLGGAALAAAVAGLAASAGAGGVAGGIVAYLKEQGIPADQVHEYQKAYEADGALVSVAIPEGGDRLRVEDVLRRFGGIHVQPYPVAA